MTYRVEFTKKAQKQLKALPAVVEARIQPKIEALANEPRPIGAARIEGEENQYRIRVGDYRVLYEIQDDVLLVLVVRVGHRREVYRMS